MNLQKITICDHETLDEYIIMVPVEGNEKILSTEPYVKDDINKYRIGASDSELKNISAFETSSSDQLIKDANITKEDNKFIIDINKKYDYRMPVDTEPNEIIDMFTDGVKYKMPISVNQKNGLNICIKDSLKMSVKNELMNAIFTKDTSTAYTAHIDSCTNGGYYVTINGVECFMPGSTASLYKLRDYDSIVGSNMMVIPISYNSRKDKIVVSHIKYLEIIKPVVLENVTKNMSIMRQGLVTLKKYDYVLITFDECLTGKLFFSDMTEDVQKMFKNNEIIEEQTILDFYIDKEADGLLSLTQTYYTKALWDKTIKEEFKPKTIVDAKIVNENMYNYIVLLKYNVIGTLSKQNTSFNIGDTTKLIVSSINMDTRKIKLQTIK